MPQSSLATIQHIQRVNPECFTHPFDWLLMIPSNLLRFFCVTSSPKMLDADVLKAQLEPTWFCGCKFLGGSHHHGFKILSRTLGTTTCVCVCDVSWPLLRWGPISSPLPPHIIPICEETHISNIIQLQNQAQLQIFKHLQTSCCYLFFLKIFVFNHLQITAIFNFQTGRLAISM